MSASLRAAAVLSAINGLGFGVFCIPAIRNLLKGDELPVVLGFTAYGGGPFERVGIPTTVPLLAGFLLVCTLECVAGWLLWGGSRVGAILALGLVPLGGIFWWGFALPMAPLFALARTALILVSWRALT